MKASQNVAKVFTKSSETYLQGKKKYSSTLKCFHFKRLRLSAASLDTLIDKQRYELIWQSHNYSHKLSPVSLNLCS